MTLNWHAISHTVHISCVTTFGETTLSDVDMILGSSNIRGQGGRWLLGGIIPHEERYRDKATEDTLKFYL